MNKFTFFMLFLSLVLGSFSSEKAIGDDIPKADPYVRVSENGRFYFKMIPGDWNWYLKDIAVAPFGIAYELQDDGQSKPLWKVDGWYAFNVYLSDDGLNLVRIGVVQNGMQPSENDLAIAFYVKGALIKEYSTAELISELDQISYTVSAYHWLASVPKLSYEKCLSFKTRDGWFYLFDAMTGEILKKERSIE